MKKSSIKVCAFVRYSKVGPSTRYRFYQYQSYLEKEGININYTPFFGDAYFKYALGKKGLIKALFLAAYFPYVYLKRFFSLSKAINSNIIHLEYDLLPMQPSFLEILILKIIDKPVIVEYDDAIYLMAFYGSKTATLTKRADLVIVGNNYLEDYSKKFNKTIKIIPTIIDFNIYGSYRKKSYDDLVLGWIGTSGNLKYLRQIEPALSELSKKFKFDIRVICNKSYIPTDKKLNVINVKWSLESYLKEMSKCTIGLMPLEDDEWARCKCAFKAIQFMSLGIPVIVSPVGMNQQVVSHEKDGFLAKDNNDWFNYLKQLLENKELRIKMGNFSQKKIIDNYNIKNWSKELIKTYRELTKRKNKR